MNKCRQTATELLGKMRNFTENKVMDSPLSESNVPLILSSVAELTKVSELTLSSPILCVYLVSNLGGLWRNATMTDDIPTEGISASCTSRTFATGLFLTATRSGSHPVPARSLEYRTVADPDGHAVCNHADNPTVAAPLELRLPSRSLSRGTEHPHRFST